MGWAVKDHHLMGFEPGSLLPRPIPSSIKGLGIISKAPPKVDVFQVDRVGWAFGMTGERVAAVGLACVQAREHTPSPAGRCSPGERGTSLGGWGQVVKAPSGHRRLAECHRKHDGKGGAQCHAEKSGFTEEGRAQGQGKRGQGTLGAARARGDEQVSL